MRENVQIHEIFDPGFVQGKMASWFSTGQQRPRLEAVGLDEEAAAGRWLWPSTWCLTSPTVLCIKSLRPIFVVQ